MILIVFNRMVICSFNLFSTFNLQNQIDNYFIRNNRYRSTMQASNQAIMSSPNRNAPVTPVFRSRYSSQTSVNSTNPFDDDYLDTMSTIDSPARRSARKKRRAPQPPQSLSSTSQSVSFYLIALCNFLRCAFKRS